MNARQKQSPPILPPGTAGYPLGLASSDVGNSHASIGPFLPPMGFNFPQNMDVDLFTDIFSPLNGGWNPQGERESQDHSTYPLSGVDQTSDWEAPIPSSSSSRVLCYVPAVSLYGATADATGTIEPDLEESQFSTSWDAFYTLGGLNTEPTADFTRSSPF